MKPGRSPFRGPVVLPADRWRQRARREGPLGLDPLDAPVPGSLLVLLSRLHRSERPGGAASAAFEHGSGPSSRGNGADPA